MYSPQKDDECDRIESDSNAVKQGTRTFGWKADVLEEKPKGLISRGVAEDWMTDGQVDLELVAGLQPSFTPRTTGHKGHKGHKAPSMPCKVCLRRPAEDTYQPLQGPSPQNVRHSDPGSGVPPGFVPHANPDASEHPHLRSDGHTRACQAPDW